MRFALSRVAIRPPSPRLARLAAPQGRKPAETVVVAVTKLGRGEGAKAPDELAGQPLLPNAAQSSDGEGMPTEREWLEGLREEDARESVCASGRERDFGVAVHVGRLGTVDVRSDVEILAHHALVEIRCDHEAKTDVAVCNCALWASEPLPSVQAAKEAWAAHALEELRHV